MIRHKVRFAILIVSVSMAASSAAAVFVTKKDAERDARAIGELKRSIAAEEQRISELRAEWSALDHPARLQALAERHAAVLRLEPLSAEQVVSAADLASAMRQARQRETEGEE